jgi:outer membrane protein OmpA-like peptidoglycan-associated protein
MKFIFTLIILVFLPTKMVLAAESPAKTADFESQYEENLYSLRDLTGVYVVLDYVTKSSEKSHLNITTNLQEEIKKRLESVGLKLLSKEEMMRTAGNPQLDIYPNYPAHLSVASPDGDSAPVIANLTPSSHQCCYTSVWGSFSQGATIARKPGSKYRLSTWGNGSNTDTCDKLGDWMGDASLKIIDNFIADYKKSKALKKKSPAKQPAAEQVKATSEVAEMANQAPQTQYMQVKEIDDTKGMACDTALMVYAQIFKTGSSSISNAKADLLDKLASHMLACKNYRYRIETHSDKRGSGETKELLSARRAISLHNYLLDKGVDEEQFEMRFFGDRKSKSNDTEEDVIITPINQQ